jgi:hypothetical protein
MSILRQCARCGKSFMRRAGPRVACSDACRFWMNVEATADQDDCWPWRGPMAPNGYGRFMTLARANVGAHRFAYAVQHGPIPSGMVVMHTCDRKCCVNPRHLRVGTQADNMADMVRKGRSLTGDMHPMRRHPDRVHRGDQHHARLRPERLARGEANGWSKLTVELVRSIRKRVASGETQARLAEELGMNRMTVLRVVNGHSWRHVR